MTTVDGTDAAGWPAVRLRAPNGTVSRRAPRFWALRAGLGWLVLLLVETGWLLSSPIGPAQHVLIVVTILLAATHLSVMPRWRFKVHRWEVAPVAVYTQTGWFNQERRIAPVARIQTVDTQRGPFERLFGITNVTVTTASARGPVRIHALDHDVAERLVEQLTREGRATAGDAS
ncbi:PH domain-containing protein [Streptomyces sp. NRRL S-337]|uniref:PH domain-containing protein n=1 Tax=Streptomyces sp. NRRL S-337 TaxID=1463900 RepID=UPI000689479A|nr:PH domain-containing protein [Streptomyces sp. NRRL S-337]